MKKVIVTDGCSFTNWGNTWATYLKKTSQHKFFNFGQKGNSNDYILQKFSERFNDIAPDSFDKCGVVIQLTGLDRKMNSDGHISPSIGNIFGQSNFKTGIFNLFGMNNTDNGQGGYDWKSYFRDEYTPEKHINDLLQNVIDLQSYFKTMNNVNYKFILGWDIFTMSDNDQWSTTNKYSNVNSKLLKDEFESSKKLWENIDFSKFWFFENENVKYGGITQWTHYNCESSDWYKSENDKHPSDVAHKKFKTEVIELMVEELLK